MISEKYGAKLIALMATALLFAGCEHYHGSDKPMSADRIIDAPVGVTVEADGGGGFRFRYQPGQFSDEEGNLDFTEVSAKGTVVKIEFVIAGASPAGLTFKRDGRNAMWLIEKARLADPNGSPPGPYQGDQFFDFETSKDGKRLTVMNKNNDGILYRYNLRFDLDGKTIEHDPDTGNGEWD